MATKRTTFSESNFNVVNNTSNLTINIYFSADNQVTWFSSATLTCTCNGVTKSTTVSHPIGGSASASFTFSNIKHNNDGTKSVSWSWRCPTDTSVLGTVTDSGTKKLTTINRAATVSDATNFNDETNPTVTFTNPGNFSLLPYLNFYVNGVRVKRIDRTKGTYTSPYTWELTNTEREELRQILTDTNSCQVNIGLDSYSGNTYIGYNSVGRTFSIVNANPIFSNFAFFDTNSTTLALTGDNSVNVNGYSNIRIVISNANKAEAQKSATMSKYQVRIGEMTPVDIAYSDSEEVSTTINNAVNGVYNVYAIDSRNNSTLVSKLATQEIAYTPISFNALNCNVVRNDNDIGEYAVLTINGSIWNGNFGNQNNSIQGVQIEYKETSSSTWLTSPTVITPTISGNTFSFTGQIARTSQDATFDLDKSYNFRISIADELSDDTIELTPMASGIPNISLADDGVGIMCDYDDSLGGLLQVGGEIVNAISIMTIGLSANTSSLSSSRKIPLDTNINSIGNRLTFDSTNYGIKIGANVSKIKISGQTSIQYSASNGQYSTKIYVNSTGVSNAYGSAYKSGQAPTVLNISPMIINVQENDVISLWLVSGTSVIRPETYLTVEVME